MIAECGLKKQDIIARSLRRSTTTTTDYSTPGVAASTNLPLDRHPKDLIPEDYICNLDWREKK
jgi:hypothetical protein